ncbi:MAG: DUF5990 family protein [Acidobacteriota bacterium]
MATRTVTVNVTIERKHPALAAFVVVPARAVTRWRLAATTTVEGTLDGAPIGRRSLVRWDQDRWFVELRRDTLAAAGKGPGERAVLAIAVASQDLPAELAALIDAVPEARARWDAHTKAQQRMLREEILGAKAPATRDRRARRALLRPAQAAAPQRRIPGLTPEPTSILVKIHGRRLPGRSCGPYADVTVGLAQKVGCDPGETVPADVGEATWTTRIEVRSGEGGRPAFRGKAVNGPPHERFLYLTWIGRKSGEPAAMFRRAKLRLDAIPDEVLASALRSGALAGRLGLTAPDGTPLCASVRPPTIAWKAGPAPRNRRA